MNFDIAIKKHVDVEEIPDSFSYGTHIVATVTFDGKEPKEIGAAATYQVQDDSFPFPLSMMKEDITEDVIKDYKEMLIEKITKRAEKMVKHEL
jgi:hypothetical protein